MYIRGGKISESYVLLPTPDIGTNPVLDNIYTTSAYFLNKTATGYQYSYLYDFGGQTAVVEYGRAYGKNPTVANSLGTLNSFGGSNMSLALSSQAYGEWEIALKRTIGTAFFYYDFVSTSAVLNTVGYAALINSSNQLLIRRYIAGAMLNMTTAFTLPDITARDVKIKIQRNQTENQYFTGAINAMRVGIKGHSDTYPIGGDTYQWSDVGVDSTYTTNTYEIFSLSTTDYFQVSSLIRNGTAISLARFNSITTVYQAKNLALYYWFNATNINDTNIFYYRKSLKDSYSIRNDRFLIYSTPQVVPALTKIQTYEQEVNL
jgi:hypothetical protein